MLFSQSYPPHTVLLARYQILRTRMFIAHQQTGHTDAYPTDQHRSERITCVLLNQLAFTIRIKHFHGQRTLVEQLRAYGVGSCTARVHWIRCRDLMDLI